MYSGRGRPLTHPPPAQPTAACECASAFSDWILDPPATETWLRPSLSSLYSLSWFIFFSVERIPVLILTEAASIQIYFAVLLHLLLFVKENCSSTLGHCSFRNKTRFKKKRQRNYSLWEIGCGSTVWMKQSTRRTLSVGSSTGWSWHWTKGKHQSISVQWSEVPHLIGLCSLSLMD